METHAFLQALALVLCVAAVTSVLFQWLRQPVLLGYVVGGLVVGPHVPIPLVADTQIIHALSELGVILLLFSLGLEFNLRRLARLGATSSLTTVIEVSATAWLGFTAGRLLGWSIHESLYAGAIVAISSTTIVLKAFDERPVHSKVRDTVLGILIVEDLVAILLMALLTAISLGSGLSTGSLAMTALRLGGFLTALVVVGLLVVPRAMRAIEHLKRPETTLIASIGICFATALLARKMGYALALGAFVAGSLVGESGHSKHVTQLVRPIRDLFVAIFFVSVGMSIDPQIIARHWPLIALFVGVVVIGKVGGVALGVFLMGHGIRVSLQTGMSLAQIGELSFVIASIGVTLGTIPASLYSIAIAVSAFTTLLTPWLMRLSGPLAELVDRRLPHHIQTFAALYGTWLERVRSAPRQDRRSAVVMRSVRWLLLDAAMATGIVISASVAQGAILAALQFSVGMSPLVSRIVVASGVLLLSLPFWIGIVRTARRLGLRLASLALPAHAEGKLDLAAAPRKSLVVTLQIAIVLMVGLPLVLVTQPFLRGAETALVFALLVILVVSLAIVFWRSTADLHGHVRAGAELILESLLAQSRTTGTHVPDALAQIEDFIPGMGKPTIVRLEDASPAVNQTLAALNLRGRTGATVLAILRDGQGILPGADDTLKAGDVLTLTGTREAIDAATHILDAR